MNSYVTYQKMVHFIWLNLIYKEYETKNVQFNKCPYKPYSKRQVSIANIHIPFTDSLSGGNCSSNVCNDYFLLTLYSKL